MKKGAALAYLFLVALLAIGSAREGLSSFHVDQAILRDSESEASIAINLEPSNVNAYKARASLFLNVNKYSEAARDLEVGLRHRPEDYLLWLRLGYARYRMNDFESAHKAYERGVSLAPFYAQPHWYLGRLLLKMDRPDESFHHLRQASAYNKNLLPQVMHLARKKFDNEADAIQKAIQPVTPFAKMALALYFIKHGLETQEMKSFISGTEISEGDRKEIVSRLIAKKNFSLAFDIWSKSRKAVRNQGDLSGSFISNGEFEEEIDLDERGFGWRLARDLENIKIKLDGKHAYSGTSSLLLDFNGESNPTSLIASQLIVIAPNIRYRLEFTARTQELVTGGLPLITITDNNTGEILARSSPLSAGTDGWRNYIVEVTTTEMTQAVTIGLQRLKCTSARCPIFGQVWLENFKLIKL